MILLSNNHPLSAESLKACIKDWKLSFPMRTYILVVPPELRFTAQELTHGGPLKVQVCYLIRDDMWFLLSTDTILEDGPNALERKGLEERRKADNGTANK